MDEVPEDALKYISVLARTQNESTEYYPITWTHAFLDIKVIYNKKLDLNVISAGLTKLDMDLFPTDLFHIFFMNSISFID